MRPAKFLLCAILSLANLALAAQKPEFGPVPGWVQPAVLPASADRDDAPVKLILMDWQFKLGTSGAEGYFESAMRIQTPQGLQSLSTLTLPWNPSTDVLTVHALQIIRGDQKVDMLAGGRTFEVLRRENSLEYAALDGVLTAAIQPEGLQVGDIIDIVYSIKRSDPALLGISEWIAMGWPSVPISSVRLRGVWSNTDKVQWKASDSLAGIQQTRHGDTTEVNLAMANVSPLVLPKGAPARYRLGRYIEFSNLKSWSQVADHMAPLYAHASSLSPQSTLNAEVARIRRSSTDRRLQAIAALALVQDQVRYVFLGMNDGALVPADADVTWSRRFGDCKAKTALLIALLRALGIDAQPVAVNTLDGESVKSGLPMVAAFNHVLVRANIDGNTYWLDGTGSGDRQVDELLMPPYRWGLPLVPKGDLVAIMPTPAAVPVTDTSIQIDATAGIPGTATVHAATAFRGQFAAAMRFTLGSLDAKARERALREFWSKVLDSVTIDKVESRFDEKDAKEYFTMEGSRSLAWVNGREQLEGIDFNYRSDFQRPEDERSDAPFAVTFPSYSRITETVKLPQADSGFWLEGDDINRVVAGAEFHRKTRIEHNVLSVETTIRTLVPEIPSSEAKAAEKSLADINSPRIYLHAPPSYLRAQGITTAAVLPQVPNLAAALVGADPNGDIDQLEKPQDQEVNALIDAGNRALNNREYERAIVELDKALQLNPKAAMALADRGMAYQWKGDIDRAKADFDAAFEIDPRNEVVPRGRGVLAMREWHYAEAIEEFTKSLDLHVDSVFTLTRRAEAYKASGDLEHAIADAEAAVRLDPLSVHPLVFLAEIQFDHNDLEGALATLNKAIAIKGETSELLIRRGIDHTRLHHQELAQKDIGAARAAASSAGALNDVCWSLASSGVELEMALEACDAALALKRDGSILDSRGFALLRMGRYDDAITSYDQSLELRPTQPESLYGRGLAKRLKGDTAGSDRDMKLAVVFDRQVGKTFEGYGLKP